MTTNKNGNYTGKVAFVTGAASGIGRATALAFAREGANLVVADISEQGNQETARLIEELGKRAITVRCDVTQAEDVKAALAKTVEAFGRLGLSIDCSLWVWHNRSLDQTQLMMTGCAIGWQRSTPNHNRVTDCNATDGNHQDCDCLIASF